MTFDPSITVGNMVTWAIFLGGLIVAWVKVSDKVDAIQGRFEKHELECSERNKESSQLRVQQAQIQSSTVTQLASLATTIASMEQRIGKIDERQWSKKGRED